MEKIDPSIALAILQAQREESLIYKSVRIGAKAARIAESGSWHKYGVRNTKTGELYKFHGTNFVKIGRQLVALRDAPAESPEREGAVDVMLHVKEDGNSPEKTIVSMPINGLVELNNIGPVNSEQLNLIEVIMDYIDKNHFK